MNSKSLRRLAADHGSLHTAGLPPNYLFPPWADGAADLTSLDILLAGPVGTPYAGGVWRLHLDIPPTYPTAPPTAQFRTRLWHPNVDEATGAVCVETLKRDWTSTLKLRDVLVTISCLLIQPNPASALNEAAGKLATEDWDGYCRRAKLMTEIHAAVPSNLANEVKEAQMRGEDNDDATSQPAVTKAQVKGKGKMRAKATPSTAKVQPLTTEDEENTRRRGQTQEVESDPESDWIPGPDQTNKPAASPRPNNNIFGIKGLEDSMQLHSPPKRIFTSTTQPSLNNATEANENHDDSDPFITVPSKRTATSKTQQPHDLHLPPPATTALLHQQAATDTDTPELLKFSHTNPFSAIQPNNQIHPFLKEFSYAWEDAHILHNSSSSSDADVNANADSSLEPLKLATRKRLASEDFDAKRKWEMKRFRRAGFDVARYNRADWGPRVGLGRL